MMEGLSYPYTLVAISTLYLATSSHHSYNSRHVCLIRQHDDTTLFNSYLVIGTLAQIRFKRLIAYDLTFQSCNTLYNTPVLYVYSYVVFWFSLKNPIVSLETAFVVAQIYVL